MHLIVHSVISLSSTHLSICWPFPAMPVVRVSVYLPWRPADVYCDGVEYSSYQYGLHQCWISHSGLARCPPAAYSNIVSRIVIFEAELWLSSLQAPEYSQRKTLEEIVSASISKQNVSFFFLFFAYVDFGPRRVGRKHWWVRGVSAARTSGRNGGMEKWWKAKTNQGQNRAWKRALIFDTWCSSFFPLFPFLPFTLTRTLGSQGNWCAAFDGKERPILTAKRPWWKGWKKERKWLENN